MFGSPVVLCVLCCSRGHSALTVELVVKACDCGLASYGPDCDIYNGQCQCRPGVTGRKCDRCETGYWDYSPSGCRGKEVNIVS